MDGWLGKLAMARYVDALLPMAGVELPPIEFEALETD
jgi:hypothetical protein